MKMIARSLAALSIAIGVGAGPPAAWSASPTAVLGSFFERANSVIRSADPTRGLDEPRRAIRGLVSEVFDFRNAASVAVGPLWRSRTPLEQEEFIRLFADLLERGYLAVFSSKANLSGGVTVQYLAESIAGEWASVPTRVLTRAGEELPVEYRLVRRGEGWTVRDVVVDGVSLVGNYRAQFARILGTSSFTDLLVRMRGGEPAVPALARDPLPAGANAPAPPHAAAEPSARTRSGEPTAGVPVVAAAGELTAGAPAAVARPEALPLTRAPEPAETVKPEPVKVEVAKPEPVRPVLVKAEPVKPAPLRAAAASGDGPARAAAPDAASTAARARYWVQLGAFKTLEAARHLISTLRPQSASISPGPGPASAGGLLNRVRVGPFADHAQATAKLREMDARGYPGFVALTQD